MPLNKLKLQKMKTKSLSIISMLVLYIFVFGNVGIAQNESKIEKVSIKTSAVCKQCKARLEENLPFEKGVTAVSLDLETKIVSIEFKKGKNSKEKLKKAISDLGYDADDIPANQKAYDRLPDCCKKDAAPH
jgi:mercuric ion binding protein